MKAGLKIPERGCVVCGQPRPTRQGRRTIELSSCGSGLAVLSRSVVRPAPGQIRLRGADLTNGGTLELQMSNTPYRPPGTATESLPPGSAAIDPQSLVGT